MLFSTVVAPGAYPGTIRWFEENRNLLNVAISRARDLVVLVCHRATLEQAGCRPGCSRSGWGCCTGRRRSCGAG